MTLLEQLVESEHVCDFDDEGVPHHKVRITLNREQLGLLRQVAAAAWIGAPLVSAAVVTNAKAFDEWCGAVDRQLTTRTGETV